MVKCCICIAGGKVKGKERAYRKKEGQGRGTGGKVKGKLRTLAEAKEAKLRESKAHRQRQRRQI